MTDSILDRWVAIGVKRLEMRRLPRVGGGDPPPPSSALTQFVGRMEDDEELVFGGLAESLRWLGAGVPSTTFHEQLWAQFKSLAPMVSASMDLGRPVLTAADADVPGREFGVRAEDLLPTWEGGATLEMWSFLWKPWALEMILSKVRLDLENIGEFEVVKTLRLDEL